MPVPVMVRFDDDLAEILREKAHDERKSLNRLINDAMRRLYITSRLGEDTSLLDRREIADRNLRELEHQESDADYRKKNVETLRSVLDYVTAVMFRQDPSLAPEVRHRSSTPEEAHV